MVAARGSTTASPVPQRLAHPKWRREAVDYVAQGKLGKVVTIRGLRFGARSSIGKVSGPQTLPTTVDYDLWSGPAPIVPLERQNLHYDWHWQWLYGNGELGNWGIHLLDGCRMAAGGGLPPTRSALPGDSATRTTARPPTPRSSTTITNRPRSSSSSAACPRTSLPHQHHTGLLGQGRDGHLPGNLGRQGDPLRERLRGRQHVEPRRLRPPGQRIREFAPTTPELGQNFIQAVRAAAPATWRPTFSTVIFRRAVHLGNISHRVGRTMPDREIRQRIAGNRELAAAYDRMKGHLSANGIDLDRRPPPSGAMLTLDPVPNGSPANSANRPTSFRGRSCRPPFIIPKEV